MTFFFHSLLAYEAAKKEVKDFYESTLSERLNQFAKGREYAARKAALSCENLLFCGVNVLMDLAGTPMSVAPISAEQLFMEDEHSDSESQSLAIREYFRHRGVQGSILEEDSARGGATKTRDSKGVHGTASKAAKNRINGSGTVSGASSVRGDDDNKSWISDASWAAAARW